MWKRNRERSTTPSTSGATARFDGSGSDDEPEAEAEEDGDRRLNAVLIYAYTPSQTQTGFMLIDFSGGGGGMTACDQAFMLCVARAETVYDLGNERLSHLLYSACRDARAACYAKSAEIKASPIPRGVWMYWPGKTGIVRMRTAIPDVFIPTTKPIDPNDPGITDWSIGR